MDGQPEFWHWMVLGILLITVELFLPGAYFLGMGVAALGVGLVLWLGPALGWAGQVLGFALASIVSILVLRRVLKARPIESEQPLLNRRGHQYVGRDFTLAEPIVNGRGKIKVDDSTWKISGRDCPAGTLVTVTGVDGVVLRVELKPRA